MAGKSFRDCSERVPIFQLLIRDMIWNASLTLWASRRTNPSLLLFFCPRPGAVGGGAEYTVTPKHLKAAIHSKRLLHQGFLRLYEYEFDVEKLGGGLTRISREIMERGNAVAVLGHDPNRDEVVLGKEFRPGVMVAGDYPYRDNLVAGAIDENETALDAAVREMREETGLVLSNPIFIHSGAYVSSGGTSEKIAIVFGTVDTAQAGGVHGNASENEDILSVVLPATVFIDRVRSGDINDLKTLVAGYWFADRHAASKK
jgi:ADP-ribose pyrophosphatase